MKSLAVIRLVAGREVRERVRSRAFRIFTALIALGVIFVGLFSNVVRNPSERLYSARIVVVGETSPELRNQLTRAAEAGDIDLSLFTTASEADARRAVARNRMTAAIIVPDGELVYRTSIGVVIRTAIDLSWGAVKRAEEAERLGLSPTDAERLLSPTPLENAVLEPAKAETQKEGRVAGGVSAVLLFIALSTYGSLVLVGVVQEKTSSIVEVLLARMRPHQLLAGKVLGIGVIAMIQLAVSAVASIIAVMLSGRGITGELWPAIPIGLLWFIAGFALYSTLFALAGSFVSRQEEAQAAAAPISLCIFGAYVTVFTIGANPDSTAARLFSLLPPFAPLLMPLRMASGSAAAWEVVVAVIGVGVATYVVLRIAAEIYARTLLHRGARVTWSEALRLRGS